MKSKNFSLVFGTVLKANEYLRQYCSLTSSAQPSGPLVWVIVVGEIC
jgi:hypothetical protein